MSANTLNGRNVSIARIPSLKSILGDKPVTTSDLYAFNGIKDALNGQCSSKDVVRVRSALDVAKQALGIFLDLAVESETMTAKSAERFMFDTAGALAFDQAVEAYGIVSFMGRFFACANFSLLLRIYPNVEETREALETARLALGHYLDLAEYVSMSLVSADKAFQWCLSTVKPLCAPRIREAVQVFEKLSQFFAGEVRSVDSLRKETERTSRFAAPITKSEVLSALQQSGHESDRILALISDLRFAVECMKGRHAARCETLLFRHELTESQLKQALLLLDAVADVINANAEEE